MRPPASRTLIHLVLFAGLLAGPSGCARTPGIFSERNARAHVNVLADSIGSRPAGTRTNAAAREYVVEQLRQAGFAVRVQETDARRRDLGRTARVSNVIGHLPGTRSEAIGLLSHFDSVAEAPGAGDDALGVAVALETARVFAARPDRTWSMFVLVTDAEESGLMGAAALVDDRDVADRLRAYLNVESIGSAGVPVLFETGPGNGWLTRVWARHAPHPRGGSYAIEVYRRLPNDTDFSIVKTLGIPGLNFAAIGDSYAYHTPRDRADRLSADTIRTMGENAVAIVGALQETDITQRSPAEATFFDIGGTVAVSYGRAASLAVAIAALLFGTLAWLRMLRGVIRQSGFWRWLLTAVWTLAASAGTAGAMVAAVWLLRAGREVYHPWYAHPGRLIALMLASGAAAGWALARIGRLLPARAHGTRHPATTWSLALPVWLALAVLALRYAPAAAYLWLWPLLAAGIVLLPLPPTRDGIVRAGSIVVLAVAGTMWLREAIDLMVFLVAVMGRLPIVTPVYVYPAVVCLGALMVAPPLVAALAPDRPLRLPSLVTAALLLAVAVTGGLAYAAPAYTSERPLRRYARAVQEAGATTAIWEVGSLEPGLDLAEDAPAGFVPASGEPPTSLPWGALPHPFVFRATTPMLGPPPARVTAFTVAPLGAGAEVAVTVVPQADGLSLSFVLPANLAPARSNLPGLVRRGRWTATFVAPPDEGVTWRASFLGAAPDALAGVQVAATLPLGMGPPAWLPQERTAWQGGMAWMLPLPAPVAPAAPLR